MKEQILIKSQRGNVKKIALIITTILSVLLIFMFIYRIIQLKEWQLKEIQYFGNSYSNYTSDSYIIAFVIAFIIIWIIAIIFITAFSKTELFVTDSRVYGITVFNKRIDLPIDMITAVGTGFFNTITISTASGLIKFSYLKNRDNIHECINGLLMNRQKKENNSQTTIKQEIPLSNADELKKYKELLDMGVITQEEFNAKKRQLLK